MKIIFLIATVSTLIINGAFSQSTVEFTRWKNDTKAAYSLNLDDFATQYFGDLNTIADVYENTGLPISFATIANWSACNTECQNEAWSWANGRLKGNEFVSHSWTHPKMDELTYDMFPQEVDSSRLFIEKHIKDNECRFYIFSNSTSGEPGFVDYIRNSEYIGCAGDGGDINAYNLTDPYMIKRSYYFPPNSTLSSLNSTVSRAIQQGNWGFKAAHNVGSGNLPIPEQDYIDHMNYCKEKVDAKELWMAPVTEILKYILERENFSLNIVSENETLMEVSWNTSKGINSSGKIDNSLFDEPLTIKTTNKNGHAATFTASPFNGNIIINYNSAAITSITQAGVKLYPQPTITLDSISKSIGYVSDTLKIKVKSSDGWSVKSDASWLTFPKITGITTDTIITVVYDTNKMDKARTAKIDVYYNDVSEIFTVKQDESPTVSTNKDVFEIGIDGDDLAFKIYSNSSWMASSNVSWITLNNESGTGTFIMRGVINANTEAYRAGTVTIRVDENIYHNVTFNQEGLTSAEENRNNTLLIYPNPACNYIKLVGNIAANSTITIVNIQGLVVMHSKIKKNQEVDITNLPSGFYSVRVENINNIAVSTFVKY